MFSPLPVCTEHGEAEGHACAQTEEVVRGPAGGPQKPVLQHGAGKLWNPTAKGHQDHSRCHEDWSEGNEERVQESRHWKDRGGKVALCTLTLTLTFVLCPYFMYHCRMCKTRWKTCWSRLMR